MLREGERREEGGGGGGGWEGKRRVSGEGRDAGPHGLGYQLSPLGPPRAEASGLKCLRFRPSSSLFHGGRAGSLGDSPARINWAE